MAVSFVGSSSGNTGTGTATSLATSFHASWQAGDVAILYTGFGGNSITVNSGMTDWTAITGFTNPQTEATNSRSYAFYRVLQGGDTAPTIGYSGSITGGWTMLIFRGAHQSTPIGQAGPSEISSTALNTASLTGVLAGSMLCVMIHARVPTGTTNPTGITPAGTYTEDVDHGTNRNTATAQNVRLSGSYRAIAAAGNYGGDSFSVTSGETASLISLHVELVQASQVVTITQVSETDTAQAVTVAKTEQITQVTETDTAQAVTLVAGIQIGQISETDTAQAVTLVDPILLAIGQVSETDTAQAVTLERTLEIGQVSEVDTSQAVTILKTEQITQVSEVDTAQAVTLVDPKIVAITQVSEVDTAQGVTAAQAGGGTPFTPSFTIQQSRWARSALTTIDGDDPVVDLDECIGQRQATFRFKLVDGISGEQLGDIHPLRGNVPTLSHDSSRSIPRTLTPLVLNVSDTSLIDPIRHRVLPYMVFGSDEYPLGRYMFNDFTKIITSVGNVSTSSLVDEMFMIDQELTKSYSTLTNVYSSTGFDVRDVSQVVSDMVSEFNVSFIVEPSEFLSYGSWPAGTNRSRVLSTVAVDCDYMFPWFDNNGVLRFIRVIDPADEVPDFDWDTRNVVIRDSITEVSDLITAPNRIIVVSNSAVSNVETTGTYDIPASAPHSSYNRGFVVPKVVDLQVETSSQATAAARNIGQRTLVYDRVELDTLPDPRHDSHNIIRFNGENWLELSWSLPLVEGSNMRHTLRKAYE